jgi:hypothetical protein
MATLYPLRSVCGNSVAHVDAYDMNLNPHGSICCGNCETILISRKSWDYLYQEAN